MPAKEDPDRTASSLQRGFALLRALAAMDQSARLGQLAEATGLTQPTTHRLLHALIAEGMVEQQADRTYRLTLELFALAARAPRHHALRDVCRPHLLRLAGSLGDTTFLLVRSGYDAICLDRAEGALPIRSFTGDIGGKIVMGTGQGSVTLLAFLPEAEREEVIRYNLPRLIDLGLHDAVSLRLQLAHAREQGFTASHGAAAHYGASHFPGIGGVAVPILDRQGYALASLSISTLAERLDPPRLGMVVDILRREAQDIASRIDPFDPTLRRPVPGGGNGERARGR
ncbi:MAG: IclR family transcriptional regulator [Janthinobacterium lividum]